MRKNLFLSSILLLNIFPLFLFTSCKSAKVAKKEKVEVTPTDKPSKSNKIDKILVYFGDDSVVKWRLLSLNGQNAKELYTNIPMMRFDESWKQIYGVAECNKFTAYYKKDNQTLLITRLSSTDRSCSNTNESLFLDTLQKIDEVSEDANTLSLLTHGQVVLVFEKF